MAMNMNEAVKMSPRDYGKSRGIQPQLIYYHIREGHIEWDQCDCGRRVISVEEADKYFGKNQQLEGD